jgi:Methyltransferase domain
MHVQYGCGFTAPEEWLNFDASMTLKWERTPLLGRLYTKNAQRFPQNVRSGDIVRGLPVGEGSSKGVYASHVLEHLALEDFHKALENTKQILEVGGIFRLIVPDLGWAATEYVRRLQAGDAQANSFFLGETNLGEPKRERGLRGLLHKSLNTSKHLWMWDALSLANALSSHGFKQIRPCSFGDCEDPMFSLVESAGRFEHAVAMEARR